MNIELLNVSFSKKWFILIGLSSDIILADFIVLLWLSDMTISISHFFGITVDILIVLDRMAVSPFDYPTKSRHSRSSDCRIFLSS